MKSVKWSALQGVPPTVWGLCTIERDVAVLWNASHIERFLFRRVLGWILGSAQRDALGGCEMAGHLQLLYTPICICVAMGTCMHEAFADPRRHRCHIFQASCVTRSHFTPNLMYE